MLAFTLFHVLVSLIGIFCGLVVTGGFAASRRLDGWFSTFFVTTTATSLTGFFLPAEHFLPSHAVAILSLIVLAVTGVARWVRQTWRTAFVVGSVVALWLNCFVLVAQLFLRVPALQQLAPHGNEPAFGASQLLVLVMMAVLGRAAVRGFRAWEAPAVA
ncbi:MAG TPA: hypothetical protein VL742_14575 [Casimicrobiaceae bacterium]|nr:hypothetical protein [Casimicrobiaceae bacterium]